MAKKSRETAKKPKTTKVAVNRTKPRRIKLGSYSTLRLQKRIKHPVKLASVWRLAKMSSSIVWQHKRLFIGITLIYGLLNLIFAQGLAGGTDVSSLKHTLNQAFTGNFGSIASGLSIFVVLVGSAGNTTNQTAGAYQTFLALIASLAIIWTLRQVWSGSKPKIRDSFYRSMYPLVPFLLVLLVVGLQFVPLLIGSTIYSVVISNGIAIFAVEKILWFLLFMVLALLSLYMVSSSVFALYIVTLPDMTPMKALRSARELVRYRRWTVLRKILCLPILLLIVAGIIMVPIIVLLTPLAQWVFFLLTMFGLTATHAYMYSLYRELLNE